MNKIDTYYLIDYENVGSNGTVIANHCNAELQMIEIPAGKQSADIHIGSYRGYLAEKSKCSIVIISNDTLLMTHFQRKKKMAQENFSIFWD